MRLLLKLWPAGHMVISMMLSISAFAWMAFAGIELVHALVPFAGLSASMRIDGLLDSIALLVIGLASLDLGQHIVEEQTRRTTNLGTPLRATPCLPRPLLVLVLTLWIEALLAAFRFSRDDPSQLLFAAAVAVASAAALGGLGIFVHTNLGEGKLKDPVDGGG